MLDPALAKPGVLAPPRIDALMEEASIALVERRYFACERACIEAATMALSLRDYSTLARILLPLQEARRMKRDMAVDAQRIFIVQEQILISESLDAGIYLVIPPRVAADARILREAGDRLEVPVIAIAREPVTRTGLVPVVSLGPVTLRSRVYAPDHPDVPNLPPVERAAPAAEPAAKPAAKKPRAKKGEVAAAPATPTPASNTDSTIDSPSIAWILWSIEQLGDAAIEEVDPGKSAASRIDELWHKLQALPEHEKLHQALAAACLDAARDTTPEPKMRRMMDTELDSDDPAED